MLTIGEHIALDAAEMEERGDGLRHLPFVLSAPGVHVYQISGKRVRVLKDPADFFGDAYLQSARSVPMTDEHPRGGMVSPAKEPESIIGHADSTPAIARDGLVYHGGTLHSQDAINKVANRRIKAVSAGFWRDLEENSGVWTDSTGNKFEYDAVSRNPRINHIALTAYPRVPEARILLDSADVAIWLPNDPMEDLKALLTQLVTDSKVDKTAGDALREALDSRDAKIEQLAADLAQAKATLAEAEAKLQSAPSLDSLHDAFKARAKVAAVIAERAELPLAELISVDSEADLYRQGLSKLGVEFSQDACEAELRGMWSVVASRPAPSDKSARNAIMANDSKGKPVDALAAYSERQRRIGLGLKVD